MIKQVEDVGHGRGAWSIIGIVVPRVRGKTKVGVTPQSNVVAPGIQGVDVVGDRGSRGTPGFLKSVDSCC